MPRSRRAVPALPPLGRANRNRHGRGFRGPATGPYLPMLRSRIDLFEMTVSSTAEYLRGIWPSELGAVSFEVAGTPVGPVPDVGVERWRVDRRARRIILYRVPIQRLSHLHRNDEMHQRMMIESCVFRAVAELIGKDPWDLAPERFHNH